MKKTVQIKYGREDYVSVEIPEENLVGIFKPKNGKPIIDEEQAIQKALDKPIGVSSLKELVRGKKSAAIAITDASRPNIEKKILPLIIQSLESGGLVKKDIKIIIGIGSHRAPYKNEIEEKLGFLKDKIKIVCHNANKSEMRYYGKTSYGYPIEINQLFAESEIKIVVGTVLPHPFAGFSGGGKMVSVGIASKSAISATHTTEMLDHPNAGWGIIENNPFYHSAIEQAKKVGVDFLINAVLDENEKLLCISAGKVQEAHLNCIHQSKEFFEVNIPEKADIVIVSTGYPKDSNLFHVCAMGVCAVAGSAVKYTCIRKDGTIIVVSPMEDGVYNQVFYDTLKRARNPGEVMKKIKSMTHLEPGHHRAYGVAQVMDKYKIIMAQSKLDPKIISAIHIEPSPSLQSALDKSLVLYGNKARIAVFLSSHRMIINCKT